MTPRQSPSPSIIEAKISGAKGGAPRGNQNAKKGKNNGGCFRQSINENEDDNGNGDGNDNADAGDATISEAVSSKQSDLSNPKQLFVHLWVTSKDRDGICVFSPLAKVENPEEWKKFWEGSDISCAQVELAVNNFVAGINNGSIARRYIPATPDRFVLGGGLTRYLEPILLGKKEKTSASSLPDERIRL